MGNPLEITAGAGPAVFALLRRRLAITGAEHDVRREILVAALADLDGRDLEDPGRLSSWLRRIAERRVVAAIRRQHVSRVDQLDPTGRAWAALRGLRPDHREVVLLRDVFGFDWGRVARMLDEPEAPNLVVKLHRRARAGLAQSLGPDGAALYTVSRPSSARSA